MRILFVLGSLRSDSASRRLAHAIQAILPEDAQSEIIDGRDLPLFDADLESQQKPPSVEAMIDQVIADSPVQVAQYREAEPDKRGKMIGYFVGQVMKASRGTANPQQVNALLKEKLDNA